MTAASPTVYETLSSIREDIESEPTSHSIVTSMKDSALAESTVVVTLTLWVPTKETSLVDNTMPEFVVEVIQDGKVAENTPVVVSISYEEVYALPQLGS